MSRNDPTRRRSRRVAGAVLALVSYASLAGAETPWLVAEPAAPHPGDAVDVRWMSGAAPPGSARPIASGTIASLQRLTRDRRVNLRPAAGEILSRFEAGGDGVELIALGARSGGKGDPDLFCKALLVVGDAREGDPLRWSELGQRLEIVPQSDPVTLARHGGDLQVQVLFEREPLAGARVVARSATAPEAAPRQRITDEIGLATLALDQPGRWIVRVEHDAACGECDGDRSPRRWSASLVLSIGDRDAR